MTDKMKNAINSVMDLYDLSETDMLRLLAAGANEMRKKALIDANNDHVVCKMTFVRDYALDWVEFMEGGDC